MRQSLLYYLSRQCCRAGVAQHKAAPRGTSCHKLNTKSNNFSRLLLWLLSRERKFRENCVKFALLLLGLLMSLAWK